MGEDRDWAAGEVGELVAVVDAEVVIDRGEQVLRVKRTLGGNFGFVVDGSDDLALTLLPLVRLEVEGDFVDLIRQNLGNEGTRFELSVALGNGR